MNIDSLNLETTAESAPLVLCRKERHRLLRKADIIRAAEHVFALKGFHKATIQDIARQAQYATGTVYLYFDDKDSLYFSIVEEKIKQLENILKLKIAQEKGSRQKLTTLIYENLKFFRKNHDFFRIFVQEESRWSLKNRIDKSTIVEKLKVLSAGLIKEAQSEGVLRKDLESKQISDMFESFLISFIFSCLADKTVSENDLKGMAEIILDLFINGAKKR